MIDEIKEKLREIMLPHLEKEDYSIDDDENLFKTRKIKASFVIAVVKWIEENFFYIQRDHLEQKRFSTLNNIAQFVIEKKIKYDQLKDQIINYVQKRLDTTDFRDDQDLFISGVADSLFAPELVNYLESNFNLKVDSDALNRFDLTSVLGLTCFIYTRIESGMK
jgi:methoxymalonate biosynthesis acyl carrier protein